MQKMCKSAGWAHRPAKHGQSRTPPLRPTQTDKKRTKAVSVCVGAMELPSIPQIGFSQPFMPMISCGSRSDFEFPALKPYKSLIVQNIADKT
jgi:hypothetical protein